MLELSTGMLFEPRHGNHSFHKDGLESSSTGSSFPADYPKHVPLVVVSPDSR